MRCQECYSEYARLTPLFKAEDCLRQHKQYRCSTCGRIICIDKGDFGQARCFRLFKSFEIAMLYVRAAEVLVNGLCGIYKVQCSTSGKVGYKISPDPDSLEKYFPLHDTPLFISQRFMAASPEQMRRLREEEIQLYLKEHQAENDIRLELLMR